MKKTARVIKIEAIICRAANVTVQELHSKERTRALVDARHAVWLLLYEHVGHSFNDIARMYGRDHTTVAHGVRRIKRTPVHSTVLEGVRKVDSSLLVPMVEGRKLRESDSWEFEK
jgi:chromosomal replication initiation ATPase DnaA